MSSKRLLVLVMVPALLCAPVAYGQEGKPNPFKRVINKILHPKGGKVVKDVQPEEKPDAVESAEMPSPPPPNPNDLLERVRRTEGLVRQYMYDLRGDQIQRAKYLLDQVDEVILGSSGPSRPGPGPGRPDPFPNPYPNPYPPQASVIVAGTIGTAPFNFTVRDTFDFFQQCSTVSVTQVDNATVSVNFGASRRITTSGWWRSSEAVCVNLVRTVVELGLQAQRFPQHVVVGIIGGQQRLVIAGNSIGELNQTCNRANAGLPSQFDTIDVTVNWTPAVRKTTSGWWRSQTEACEVILREFQSRHQ